MSLQPTVKFGAKSPQTTDNSGGSMMKQSPFNFRFYMSTPVIASDALKNMFWCNWITLFELCISISPSGYFYENLESNDDFALQLIRQVRYWSQYKSLLSIRVTAGEFSKLTTPDDFFNVSYPIDSNEFDYFDRSIPIDKFRVSITIEAHNWEDDTLNILNFIGYYDEDETAHLIENRYKKRTEKSVQTEKEEDDMCSIMSLVNIEREFKTEPRIFDKLSKDQSKKLKLITDWGIEDIDDAFQ